MDDVLAMIVRCVLIAAIGFPLLYHGGRLATRVFESRMSDQGRMLLRKGIFYVGSVILVILILNNLGFKLTALLGTAGIVGVAVGFASQTSLANVISGLFMIGEKTFSVGDFIEVDGLRGTVLSIDLLSVKLRTLDNRFVRVPNESMLKQNVVNITRFPIRRWDLTIGVAYKEDLGHVIEVLNEVATANPFCLDEPEPLIQFTNFGESACEIFFAVWFEKSSFMDLRRSLHQDIKKRFDAEGIEIPFPHRTLYTGAITEPFPVRVVGDSQGTIVSEAH